MARFFPQHLYKHQIYPMIFIIIYGTISKIILILFLDKNKNKYEENISLSIFIIIFYIFISILFSFSEIKIKVFIDLKYLSPYSIILLIGIIGFSLTIIISLIFKLFEYHEKFCFDDIFLYFKILGSNLNEKTNYFYLEICLITPLYLIMEFLCITFIIFIYKYLNPYYLILSDNIYFLVYLIFVFINNKSYNDSESIYYFVIDESTEIFEFIAFCIYLEIIELRFCGLNKNTRKNIIKRGENDSKNYIENLNEDNNSSDEEDEDNDNKLELLNIN